MIHLDPHGGAVGRRIAVIGALDGQFRCPCYKGLHLGQDIVCKVQSAFGAAKVQLVTLDPGFDLFSR